MHLLFLGLLCYLESYCILCSTYLRTQLEEVGDESSLEVIRYPDAPGYFLELLVRFHHFQLFSVSLEGELPLIHGEGHHVNA